MSAKYYMTIMTCSSESLVAPWDDRLKYIQHIVWKANFCQTFLSWKEQYVLLKSRKLIQLILYPPNFPVNEYACLTRSTFGNIKTRVQSAVILHSTGLHPAWCLWSTPSVLAYIYSPKKRNFSTDLEEEEANNGNILIIWASLNRTRLDNSYSTISNYFPISTKIPTKGKQRTV